MQKDTKKGLRKPEFCHRAGKKANDSGHLSWVTDETGTVQCFLIPQHTTCSLITSNSVWHCARWFTHVSRHWTHVPVSFVTEVFPRWNTLYLCVLYNICVYYESRILSVDHCFWQWQNGKHEFTKPTTAVIYHSSSAYWSLQGYKQHAIWE